MRLEDYLRIIKAVKIASELAYLLGYKIGLKVYKQ